MVKTVNETTVKFKGVESPKYIVDKEGNVTKKGKLLRYRINSGREYASIKFEDGYKLVQVAEVVLESFMGRPEDLTLKIVGFRDGVTTNSRLDNLFWTHDRNWWEDSRVNIKESVIEKVLKESKSELTESTKELAERLNLQKGVVDYIIDTDGTPKDQISDESEESSDDIEPSVADELGSFDDSTESLVKNSSLELENYESDVSTKSPTRRVGISSVGRYGMADKVKPISVKEDEPSYAGDHKIIQSTKLPSTQIGRIGVINTVKSVEVREDKTLTVEEECRRIIKYEIPALRYAGVKTKKILVFILYKYGKEVYEHFILNYVDKL